MKIYRYLFGIGIFIAISTGSFAQAPRVDTTLKAGKSGYRLICNNKSADKNEMMVKPIGFENTAHPLGYYVKGRVIRADIDDLNNDGYPDMLVYLTSGDHGEFGSVYAFMSVQNKSVMPAMLPDVMLDGKLKDGYKGGDEFQLLEGRLLRKFPLYKADDEKDKPTGGKRVIQYQITGSEEAGFKFVVLRSFDTKQ